MQKFNLAFEPRRGSVEQRRTMLSAFRNVDEPTPGQVLSLHAREREVSLPTREEAIRLTERLAPALRKVKLKLTRDERSHSTC